MNAQKFEAVSTKQRRIAKLAKENPELVFTSLNHLIDRDWLMEAYLRTRKDGAPGVDGVTGEVYARNLRANLSELLNRLKSGNYRAPRVRRAYIMKEDGTKRPLGLPTFEDKIAQRAIVMLLEPIYEQDFCECSYGFRPKRSAHDALECLRNNILDANGNWVLDIDISNYFDSIEHTRLRELLDKRVKDGVVRKLIDKWLKAGNVDQDRVQRGRGTPQGGVISPLLANLFLHEVLDKWFEETVIPRLRNRARLVRFADDGACTFESKEDCERVYRVLGKRLAKYGLTLHPEKTRIVDFSAQPKIRNNKRNSFDFLGFTHFRKRSRRGYWVVGKKTAKKRFARNLKRISLYCRRNRHLPIPEQHTRLRELLTGHYSYFAVVGNGESLRNLLWQTNRIWYKWLKRRNGKRGITWTKFNDLLRRHPLPQPRVLHKFGWAS